MAATFEFPFKDGVVRLPVLEMLPTQVSTAAASADNRDELVWLVIEGCASGRDLELIDSMTLSELKLLIKSWELASTVTIDEVVQLARVIEEHGAALEYDLIGIGDGLRLRDCPSEEFNWRDLLVIVKHSDDTTKLWASRNPKYAGWTLSTRLLAIIANALRWLVWAKTKDGSSNRNRPVPIGPDMGSDTQSRPGLKPKAAPLSKVKQMLGGAVGGERRRDRKLGNLFGN